MLICQLESEPERYNGYVPMAYGDYLEKMNKFVTSLYFFLSFLFVCFLKKSPMAIFKQIHAHMAKIRSGEWGDHVTLQAAADSVWANTLPCRFLLLSAFLSVDFHVTY